MKYPAKFYLLLLIVLFVPSLSIDTCDAHLITTYQEQDLGSKAFQAVKKHMVLIQDPVINDYIQNLGYSLVAHSPKPRQPFHFFVIRNSTINAFSLPGGYIGIFSGLVLKTDSEAELAAVLAHEIAHVTQRHIARMIADQKRAQISNIAALIAAIALGRINGAAASGITTATMAGNAQHMLNFTRIHEKEADRIGMQILTNAGFNPQGMSLMLNRLAEINRLDAVDIPEYLLTHPLTIKRLADVANRVAQYPSRTYKDNKFFNLIRARLQVEAMTHITAADLPRKNCYAKVLMLAKIHQWQAAKQQIDLLIKQNPTQILFKMTKADIEKYTRNISSSLAILQVLYQTNSTYYPLILQYCATLIENKQYHQALTILKYHDVMHATDEQFLSLLFTAQMHCNLKIEAHQTRAKIYLLNGNKQAAIMQLKIAIEYAAKRPFLLQQIKTQLAQLK
jgi:predicted Zn-dependent protease